MSTENLANEISHEQTALGLRKLQPGAVCNDHGMSKTLFFRHDSSFILKLFRRKWNKE